MGFLSKIKKAFKKVVKGIKKVVKKAVKRVKKVVKKIGSSKILKALAIAAAVVVTGGAALTAFGGTMGTGAMGQLGTWMMSTSQSVLGGSALGTAVGKEGVARFLTQAGNFAAKTVAAPFGAVGGALGSTARVGANLLSPDRTIFQAGEAGAGTAVTAPKPFSRAALTGQNVVSSDIAYDANLVGDNKYYNTKTGVPLTNDEFARLPESFTNQVNLQTPQSFNAEPRVSSTGDILKNAAINQGFSLAGAAIQSEYFGEDPRGRSDSLFLEGKSSLTPLQVWASENKMDIASIYNSPTYGTADPYFAANASLYTQDTIGTPTATTTGENYNV